MVQTDKYKKEILSIIDWARKQNPFVGEYQRHYINKNATFIVSLNNGYLEIELGLIKEYERNDNMTFPPKFIKSVEGYSSREYNSPSEKSVGKQWNKLFS